MINSILCNSISYSRTLKQPHMSAVPIIIFSALFRDIRPQSIFHPTSPSRMASNLVGLFFTLITITVLRARHSSEVKIPFIFFLRLHGEHEPGPLVPRLRLFSHQWTQLYGRVERIVGVDHGGDFCNEVLVPNRRPYGMLAAA